jgi:hypothetical protein
LLELRTLLIWRIEEELGKGTEGGLGEELGRVMLGQMEGLLC